MAIYECNKCGMGVETSCSKCKEPLVDATLTLDDGRKVQIAQCPKCQGKIKSPLCCGVDMSCEI